MNCIYCGKPPTEGVNHWCGGMVGTPTVAAPKVVNRHCPTHGDWNLLQQSGCPDCVAELRLENVRLRHIIKSIKIAIDNASSLCSTISTVEKQEMEKGT